MHPFQRRLDHLFPHLSGRYAGIVAFDDTHHASFKGLVAPLGDCDFKTGIQARDSNLATDPAPPDQTNRTQRSGRCSTHMRGSPG